MASTDEISERFILEGLFKYAEAQATVAAFEEAVRSKLQEIARPENARPLGMKSGTKVGVGFCAATGGGRAAYVTFPGEFRGDSVTWEVGIWWQHPSDGRRVAVYAECLDGPAHLVKKRWATLPRSATGEWGSYEGGLDLTLQPNMEIDAAFKILFNEIANQSSAAS